MTRAEWFEKRQAERTQRALAELARFRYQRKHANNPHARLYAEEKIAHLEHALAPVLL